MPKKGHRFVCANHVKVYGSAMALGLLLPLAFAPYSWLPLLYGAMAGFYGLVQYTQSVNSAKGWRKFFIGGSLGWCFGLGWFMGVSWVIITLTRFGGLTWPFAALATLLFIGYLALFPAWVGGLQSLASHGLLLRWRYPFGRALIPPLIFAHLVTLSEALRGVLFGGFPWLSWGYAHAAEGWFAGLALAPYAPWLGWLGLTWLSAWFAALMFEAVRMLLRWRSATPPSRSHRIEMAMLLLITLLNFAGVKTINIQWTKPLGAAQTFQLIQGNINLGEKWDVAQYEKNLQHFRELMRDDPKSVMVLPETALTVFDLPPSQAFMQHWQGTLVVGGIERTASNEWFNAVAVVPPNTPASKASIYRKRHLVPFGEYPPPGFAWFARLLNIPMASLSAGATPTKPIAINHIPSTIAVCYENLFPEEWRPLMNQSTLLINTSNTGWYGDSWAMPQHLQISHLRALEMQKPVLHVADTGITAAINAEGRITDRLPALQAGSLLVQVQGFWGETPYQRFGNWLIFGWIALTLLFLALAHGVALRQRQG